LEPKAVTAGGVLLFWFIPSAMEDKERDKNVINGGHGNCPSLAKCVEVLEYNAKKKDLTIAKS